MVKIEKDVPIPKPKAAFGVWPEILKQMNIGDSFAVDDDPNSTNVRRAAKGMGMKVAVRKLEKGGWRVWRVE